MSTNRTKIDWAYKQAVRIVNMFDNPDDRPLSIQKIAGALRLARRRGQRDSRGFSSVETVAGMTIPEIVAMRAELDYTDFEGLTAATIRECKKQLKAVELHPDANGQVILKQNYRQADNLGGYPERCVHGRTLGDTCKSCGRA